MQAAAAAITVVGLCMFTHREPTHRFLAQVVSHLLFIRVNEIVACGVHVVQGIVQEWQHREEWFGSRARSAVELVP